MSVEEIRNSDDRYKQYQNFNKYYKDLMEGQLDLKILINHINVFLIDH